MDVRRPLNDGGSDLPPAPVARATSNNGGGGLWRIAAIVLILSGIVFLAAYGSRALAAVRSDGSIKGKQYQALFLTNGQVYFGKLSHTASGYVKLTNIYYLQVQQSVQPGSTSTTATNNNQQVSLAKLGGELHGPEDTMFVSREQVLFWENLKTDGKVAQAISNYQSTNK